MSENEPGKIEEIESKPGSAGKPDSKPASAKTYTKESAPSSRPSTTKTDSKPGTANKADTRPPTTKSSKSSSGVSSAKTSSAKSEPEKNGDAGSKEELKGQFEAFAKFGDKAADGKTIKLSQSDKWFKQAKVIEAKKLSTTDTGIAFRKISKNSPKLSFADWNKFLDELAKSKNKDVNEIKTQLVACGKPGFSGTTAAENTPGLSRLTDPSKYGGTHKNRFDSDGKGRGKEGRT